MGAFVRGCGGQLVMGVKLVVFDFDGVFTDNAVYVSQSGEEMVRCWRGDGIGIQRLKKHGIDVVVISTESNDVVKVRCAKLGIQCITGSRRKLSTLQQVAGEKRVQMSDIAFVGNDINDMECLKAVGMPIVVHDAHPDVKSTLPSMGKVLVTSAAGGYGAVREVCDYLVMEATK